MDKFFVIKNKHKQHKKQLMNNASNTIYRATLSKSAAYTPKLLGIFFFFKLILNNLFIQWQKEIGEVIGKLVHLIKTSGKVT